MSAYSEWYLEDAMSNLGGMMDYAINDCGYTPDDFFEFFMRSSVGHQFANGNPKYLSGKSGIELACDVMYEMKQEMLCVTPTQNINRTREYWSGHIYAYYQWIKGMSFEQLYHRGLTMSKVLHMYILHEADEDKFVESADRIIHDEHVQSQLKRLRMYCGYTQKELSQKSGVSLRMIQLYEQGQNDLSRAQAKTVVDLARTLNCRPEQLYD